MTKLSQLPRSEFGTFLIYGPTGTGKTHFAAGTVGSRAAIIDIGNSKATLLSKYFRQRFPENNPDIIEIDTKNDIKNATAFDNVLKALEKCFNSPDYDTIVIDEVTALRRFAEYKAAKINDDLGKSKTREQSLRNGVLMPAVQDYGTEMRVIAYLVSTAVEAANQTKKNFILVAHERRVYKAGKIGESKTLTSVRPGFTGETFPDDICAHFDYVWHTSARTVTDKGVSTVQFNLRTQPNAIITAKTRGAGVLAEVEKDPNFLDIMKRLRA